MTFTEKKDALFTEKRDALRKKLEQLASGHIALAFSGGVDSSLLLFMCCEAAKKSGQKDREEGARGHDPHAAPPGQRSGDRREGSGGSRRAGHHSRRTCGLGGARRGGRR